jgi:hypothetical protein
MSWKRLASSAIAVAWLLGCERPGAIRAERTDDTRPIETAFAWPAIEPRPREVVWIDQRHAIVDRALFDEPDGSIEAALRIDDRDRVVAIDGLRAHDRREAHAVLRRRRGDQDLTLEIERSGRRDRLHLKLRGPAGGDGRDPFRAPDPRPGGPSSSIAPTSAAK